MTDVEALRAVERAVDAALGEVVRQAGTIDPQIMREARGCGLDAGRFPLEHAADAKKLLTIVGNFFDGEPGSQPPLDLILEPCIPYLREGQRPPVHDNAVGPLLTSILRVRDVTEVRVALRSCTITPNADGSWPVTIKQWPDGSVDILIRDALILGSGGARDHWGRGAVTPANSPDSAENAGE